MIDVHFVPSPNGHKVSIMLEEIGLPYRLIDYNLFKGDQLTKDYKKINPNNRLPAIIDHDPADGSVPVTIFESGACLIYLAEKSGKLLPRDLHRRSETFSWLMWQMAGLGPMHGQAHHFVRYAPDDNEYGKKRYTNEANRLLDVLEYRLAQAEFLAGDYSIADIACWPWVRAGRMISVEIGDRTNLDRWYKAIEQRPAVIRGGKIPEGGMQAGPANRRVRLTPEQWSAMFGEKMLNAAKG